MGTGDDCVQSYWQMRKDSGHQILREDPLKYGLNNITVLTPFD